VKRWRVRAPSSYAAYAWIHAYGMPVADHDTAVTAIDKMRDFAPLPAFYGNVIADAFIGRMYLRAGRPAEAIEPLQRVARGCQVFFDPLDHSHALLDLGLALEEAGRTSEACDAYARLVKRWGAAKPTSVSASTAKAHARALHCRGG